MSKPTGWNVNAFVLECYYLYDSMSLPFSLQLKKYLFVLLFYDCVLIWHFNQPQEDSKRPFFVYSTTRTTLAWIV